MQHRFSRLALGALAALALIAAGWLLLRWRAAPRPAPGPDPDLVATVGPRQIRVADVARELARRGGPHPDKVDTSALLDEMIEREVLIGKSLQAGLDKDPGFVREWQNLLIGRLRGQELEPRLAKATVSDDEVRAYYEQNRARYTQPAKRRLAIDFVATHAKMNNDERARCQVRIGDARQKALLPAGAPAAKGFGALAIEYSEDQATRYKGGDIGWVEAGREKYAWDAAVVAAGFSLAKVGDVSEAVRTERGLYLVRLMDMRDATVTPLERVAEQVRHSLLLEKRRQTEQAFLDEARAGTAIAVFRDALARVPRPPPAPARPEAPPEPR